MGHYEYSSNAWGYSHVGRSFSVGAITERICSLGFDGFDLLVGDDAYPACSIDERPEFWEELRHTAEDAGGSIASLTLVSCPLQDETECLKQFELAIRITENLGTHSVNLLPRKIGITQDEGFRHLERIWGKVAPAFKAAEISVCAENHVWAPNADDDLFLLRTEADFCRLVDATDGGVRVKFDPAWLLKPGAAEEPVPAFERLLPYVSVLDLKDCTPAGELVMPGTGAVDFEALARLAANSDVRRLAVEAEHHMAHKPPLSNPEAIDRTHISALKFYKEIFEGILGKKPR